MAQFCFHISVNKTILLQTCTKQSNYLCVAYEHRAVEKNGENTCYLLIVV